MSEELSLAANTATNTASQEDSGFSIVQGLAQELSAGRVDLPSFPDAAARVQQAVSDPNSTSERVARVVSADAGLASRIITMANSALLHRGDDRVTDLKMAITRIGYQHVRTAALAYASAQLRRAPELAHLRPDLERCWKESIRVAALTNAIARESQRVRSDEAMLAGLMHNIGKVYIIARVPRDSAVMRDPERKEQLVMEWYPSIGQALIENWKLPEEIAVAVGGQRDLERAHIGPPDMQDLLVVAVALVAQMERGADSDDNSISQLHAAKVLGLDDSAMIRVMLESQTDLEMLNAALG